MSIATPSIDALRDNLSDELKDIRLNLSSVLVGENLQPLQSLGVALAAAAFVRCRPLAEAIEAGQHGFARLPWRLVGPEGEAELNKHTLSVRCLQSPEGDIPDDHDAADLVCLVARSY